MSDHQGAIKGARSREQEQLVIIKAQSRGRGRESKRTAGGASDGHHGVIKRSSRRNRCAIKSRRTASGASDGPARGNPP